MELDGGESGIAPGQACVFYADDTPDTRVLGGGFISRTQRETSCEAELQALLAAPGSIEAGRLELG